MDAPFTEYDFGKPDENAARRLSQLRPFVRLSGDSVRKRWHIGERCVFDWLWVFIGSGEGVFRVGGEEFNVAANDFVWIPPDTPHEMSGTSETMRCLFAHVDLIFDPVKSFWGVRIPAGLTDLSRWRDRMPEVPNDPGINSLRGLVRLRNPAAVLALFTELCESQRLHPDMFLRHSGLALGIIDETLRSRETRNHLEMKLSGAETVIRASVNKNLDVGALARGVGLSASYFRRLFRESRGVSPSVFHRDLRVREAVRLLADHGMNVSETADALGFSNIHNFSRAVKAVTGLSPKKYCGKP